MKKRKPIDKPREDLTFRLRRGLQRMMSRYSKSVGQKFNADCFEIVKVEVKIRDLPIPFKGYRIVKILPIIKRVYAFLKHL